MASQRSCGAFLLSGRCKLACIRQDSKKAPAGRRPGMPFQVARAPRRASRECTGPPARAQSRQGMHRAPGPHRRRCPGSRYRRPQRQRDNLHPGQHS
jgi:hypothetical protein